jgi:hypothetical protein
MSFSLDFAMLLSSVEPRALPLESRPVTGERDAVQMKRLGVRREKLAAVAVVLALPAAGAALAFAVTAGAAPQAAQQETTTPTPTDTGPSPDPAPKPAPKLTPKPNPATTTHRSYTPPPTHTYSAPTRAYSAPAYTPPRSKPPVTKKHKVVPKKKRPSATPATTSTPVDTTPAPAALVPLGAKQTPSSSGGGSGITSILFIAGVTFAALLFLVAAAVPGTPARFTPVGRVVFEHQQDLVLVGLAAFVITVFVYVITGHGL